MKLAGVMVMHAPSQMKRHSMKCRILILLFCFAALIGSAAGQTKKVELRRTSTPDIQGIWNFATITPLERPADLAEKEFFTEQEAAEYEKRVLERTNMDRRDGGAQADVERAYNDFWWDRGTKVVKSLRTSLIIDPKNGRVPPLYSFSGSMTIAPQTMGARTPVSACTLSRTMR